MRPIEKTFRKDYIAPWRYNQIVGWIRIYKLGCQIRGEFWLITAKRFARNLRKKQFLLCGEAFNRGVFSDQSSKEIFHIIRNSLIEFEEQYNRNIVIDIENFQELGEFVDWRQLMLTE